MQLQRESNPALNTVTAYGDDYIEINAVTYRHAVFFGPEGDIKRWAVMNIQDITAATLREAAGITDVAAPDPMAFLDDSPVSRPTDAPEVLLIGTGKDQRFLPSHMTQGLLKMGIGVETMSTQAAARTYNILMAEGRKVIAALLPLEPLQ